MPEEPPTPVETWAESEPVSPRLPRRDPELEKRVRQESKTHPMVLQVIESLDAELREIRTPRVSLTVDPS